eukprot:Rmarinus@m.337
MASVCHRSMPRLPPTSAWTCRLSRRAWQSAPMAPVLLPRIMTAPSESLTRALSKKRIASKGPASRAPRFRTFPAKKARPLRSQGSAWLVSGNTAATSYCGKSHFTTMSGACQHPRTARRWWLLSLMIACTRGI